MAATGQPRWSAAGAAEPRSIQRRCVIRRRWARARLGPYRRAVTRFFRTAGAVAGILTVPSTPDASAVVTMRLMIIPCLTGAGPTWCEPRILELAMLPAVLSFIDMIVIPFLNTLYGSVGYLGVMAAMTIESAGKQPNGDQSIRSTENPPGP